MNAEQLTQFKNRFADYVRPFYGDDDYVNANLRLKEDHTKRVCDEILYLCSELNLDENRKRIAETIALLHDIARFPQFAKYRTYHDARSLNHCTFAVRILIENKILRILDPVEKQLVLKAIEYHGAKELSADLDEQTMLFCKLIRDADKLDIYYVMIENYRRHRQAPSLFCLEVELPDEPYYSPEIIDDILNERNVDYEKLKTWNDMKLLNLAWVYDINFTPTLKRIKQRRFLELVLEFLPDTADIRRVRKKVLDYLNSAIKQGK